MSWSVVLSPLSGLCIYRDLPAGVSIRAPEFFTACCPFAAVLDWRWLTLCIALVAVCVWLSVSRSQLRRAGRRLQPEASESPPLPPATAAPRTVTPLLPMDEDLTTALQDAVLSVASPRELCSACIDRIASVLNFDAAVLYLFSPQGERLEPGAATQLTPSLSRETDLAAGSSSTVAFLLRAIETRSTSHIVGDFTTAGVPELAQAARDAAFQTIHVLPLMCGRRAEGVLLGFMKPVDDLDADRLHALDLLSRRLAYTLRLKHIEYQTRLDRHGLNDLLATVGDRVIPVDREFRVLGDPESRDDAPGGSRSEAGLKCYEMLHGRGEPCPGCPVTSAFESGHLEQAEVEVESPDGGKKWFEVTATPLRNEAGEVQQVIVLSHDVTPRHLLEEQLLWSDKLSAVGELIAGVAHELNNPLAAVLGFSELLLREGVPEGVRDDLRRIYGEASRCKRIVQNLLSFARRTPPEKRRVSINELLMATMELKAYQLRVDNVTVLTHLNGRLPSTLADAQQLQQVFLNLLNNAHDAIREKETPGTITVSTRLRGDRIVIRVADTGVGIKSRNLRRIFDPFYTTKEPGRGTGLGLSLAYGIIKQHDGDIHVESSEGRGTTFTIELPVLACTGDEEREGKAKDAGPAEPLGVQLSILVVDDEPTMVELIASLLTLDGHRVTSTADGRQAMRLIEQQTDEFDLIITDVKMPGVSGERIYSRVRELRPDLAQRIIFTTGDTASPETRSLLEFSGNPVLEKPFRIEELRQTIAHTVCRVS